MATLPRLMATIFPTNAHFTEFANDPRLAGIRLNHPMVDMSELEAGLNHLKLLRETVPLWYDVKARQPRVVSVIKKDSHLEIELNHPISVHTPSYVLFKSGKERGIISELQAGGQRLIVFPERNGKSEPVTLKHVVFPGESLHILDPSLVIHEPLFTTAEVAKIERLRKEGFTRWFLSYVECQKDIDRFLEIVGRTAEVLLKIESKKGLNFVAHGFKKRENLTLVAARGDLYVELERPEHMPRALQLIIDEDAEAIAGSRILLSTITDPQASCADVSELAWLHAIGYRTMMLCDEMCVRSTLLEKAIAAFHRFYLEYC